MQTENRFLDDLARVASGALGSLAGVRTEVEARLKHQFKRILEEMDLVSREEFDAVKAMAAKARKEQLSISKRLIALEASLKSGKKPPRRSPRRSAGATKKPTAKRRSKSP
jgi:BMFP domain-containing protein YqiC